jgi:hypothetical protein
MHFLCRKISWPTWFTRVRSKGEESLLNPVEPWVWEWETVHIFQTVVMMMWSPV